MSVTQITDYLQRAKDYLIEQYKEKPNMEAFIKAYTDQIDALETAFFELYDERALANAIGQQLDNLGTIVGIARNGETDDRYRQLISVKIGQNTSQGEIESIIGVFKILTESDWVQLSRLNDATISLTGTVGFADQDETNFIFFSMQRVLAAGVRLAFIICSDIDEAFAYAGTNSIAPGLGYDDGTGTIGGKYATAYQEKKPFAYEGVNADALGYGAGSDDPLVGGVYVA